MTKNPYMPQPLPTNWQAEDNRLRLNSLKAAYRTCRNPAIKADIARMIAELKAQIATHA